MTCDTARTLLLFYRPGSPADLAAEDVAALESHLAGCPDCAAAVSRQAAADAVLARAFRQVPVPDGLKSRLHTRASAALGRAWWRTWLTRAAVAAAVAVGGLIGAGVHIAKRPSLDPIGLAMETETAIEQPGPTTRDWMNKVGVPGPLPEDFDYQKLATRGYADLQGEQVPMLEFRVNGEFARVYLLHPHQFNVKDAIETQSSLVTVRLYKDRPAAGWTVVIVHTGNDLQRFLRVPGIPQ